MIPWLGPWIVEWASWSGTLVHTLTALGLVAWGLERVARWLRRPLSGEWTVALWALVPTAILLAWLPATELSSMHLVPDPRDWHAPPGPMGPAWAALVWGLGFVGLGALFTTRELRRSRLLRREAGPACARAHRALERAAARVGSRSAVELLEHPTQGPLLVGLLRPAIVVPRGWARDASPTALVHVLAHELAHQRRRDPWRALALTGLCLLAWWHPAVWIARRRLAGQRELACDRLAAGRDAAAYRATLLELARPLARSGPGLALIGPGAMPALLLRRLAALAPGAAQARPSTLRRLGAAAAFLVLGTAALRAPVPTLADRLPPLEELEGCIQLRYAVHGLLGESERTDTP